MSTFAMTPASLPMVVPTAPTAAGLPGGAPAGGSLAGPAGPSAAASAFMELLAAALGGQVHKGAVPAEQPDGGILTASAPDVLPASAPTSAPVPESDARTDGAAGDAPDDHHDHDHAAAEPRPSRIAAAMSASAHATALALGTPATAPADRYHADLAPTPAAPTPAAPAAAAPLARPAGLDEAVDAVAAGIRTLSPASPRKAEPAARGASLEGLDPTFRTALERTISRMTAEGHTVRVVETSRTQARQDALYEQGRTVPGPVVTWTRRSRHLVGRAADLQVDGEWSGVGYARLQKIAREEGLHTLGARDPGHVELRRVATGAASGATLASSAAPASPAAPMAPMRAAAFAAPAKPGAGIAEGQGAHPASSTRDAAWDHPAFAAGLLRGRASAMSSVERGSLPTRGVAGDSAFATAETALREALELQPSLGTESSGAERTARDWPALQPAPRTASPAAAGSIGGSRPDAPTVHTLLAHRIDQLLSAREQARAQPLAHIAMAIDAANGTTDHVRIGIGNGTLGATILTSDPEAARRMGRDIGGLTEALARAGIDESAVTVRDIGTAVGRAAPARPIGEALDPAAVTAAARSGPVEALRPAAPGGDAGADSRRHEREPSQRHGGDHSSHSGGQRDGEQRRQRRDPREQALPPNRIFSSLR